MDMWRNNCRSFIYAALLVVVSFLPSCQWLPEVGKVSLSESSVTLKVGGSKQLSATVEPAAAEYEEVSWTSSDPSVVSVSNGTIVAKKVGTAQITASAAGVSSSPCQVTVDATHVTGITLSQYSVEVTEGESITISATVSPSDATNPSIQWISDNTSVASVQNGKIVALSPGTANITVLSTDGNKTATCKVTVKSKVIDVTSITLSHSAISVKEEVTMQLKATVKPSNATNQEVSWSSGDTGIASVASDGTVTGVTEGTTTITAKSANGKVTATCKVTVTAEYVDFPDSNFRKYMVDNYDLNKNGKISLTEAKKVTSITVSTIDIESLEGIEMLNNLVDLDVSNPYAGKVSRNKDGSVYYENIVPSGRLTSLDLSCNVGLRTLKCGFNQLTSLDLSKNSELILVDCSYNYLRDLKVDNNASLEILNCHSNDLSSLDVTNNSLLKELDCYYNRLKDLSIYENKLLVRLECGSNRLETIDISNNRYLKQLECTGNHITSLNLYENVKLEDLNCNINPLYSLDVSRNTELRSLSCSYNYLTAIDVSNNTKLTYLSVSNNGIKSINLSNNAGLISLYVYKNQLEVLDISKNVNLELLICCDNPLKTLFVSSGQSINGVTVNRSTSDVPAGTSIVTK